MLPNKRLADSDAKPRSRFCQAKGGPIAAQACLVCKGKALEHDLAITSAEFVVAG